MGRKRSWPWVGMAVGPLSLASNLSNLQTDNQLIPKATSFHSDTKPKNPLSRWQTRKRNRRRRVGVVGISSAARSTQPPSPPARRPLAGALRKRPCRRHRLRAAPVRPHRPRRRRGGRTGRRPPPQPHVHHANLRRVASAAAGCPEFNGEFPTR